MKTIIYQRLTVFKVTTYMHLLMMYRAWHEMTMCDLICHHRLHSVSRISLNCSPTGDNQKILQFTFCIWTVWIDHSANISAMPRIWKWCKDTLSSYIFWKHITLASSTALFWPSTTKYQLIPSYTDPVTPKNRQYRPLLTKYNQVPTITALYWPSISKYRQVLSSTDPVQYHKVQTSIGKYTNW